jgi:uncharacterized membrane protein
MFSSKFNSSFRWLMILIIVLGIFFRFVNLDRKIFWTDEVFTALRSSGQTGAAAIESLYTGKPVAFSDMAQHFAPMSGTNLMDVVQGIAIEDPHLPPFYFLAVRVWSDLWGDTPAVIRSLSAVLGVLALPAMYWLGLELFRSPLTAGISSTLLAISPIHVLYSQEARAYSLWTVLILVSSALLLRSLRRSTPLNWGLYALTVSLGLYTHLFCAFVNLGHGGYVLLTERFNRKLGALVLAGMVGVATFLPWIQVLVANLGEAEKMVSSTSVWKTRFSLPSLMTMWLGNLSRVFFDVGVGSSDDRRSMLILIPIILASAALSAYCIYFLIRNSHFQVWLLVVSLIVTPSVFYIASDLINGGRISGVPRYCFPMYIGVQLAVAFTLSSHIDPKSPLLATQPRLWKTLAMVIFSLGVASCVVSMPAELWWNKGPAETRPLLAGAALINQTDRPLIITQVSLNRAMELGYELRSDAEFQLVLEKNQPQLPPDRRPLFFFRPNATLRASLARSGKLTPLPGTEETMYQLK